MTTTQEPVSARAPIAADEAELATLRALRTLLSADESLPTLLVKGERESAIPPTLLFLLRRLVEHLAHERAVRMETFGQEVSLWEAADILGDPIEQVRQLIAEGTLAARDVTNDQVVNLRLIKLTDLLTHLGERSEQRHEALRELTRMSEEMGLYDLEDEACPPA